MATSSSTTSTTTGQQSLFICRHGERMDLADPYWADTAPRPYDPPLTKKGVEQAKQLAKELKGKNIKHVIASPFLRCLKTGQCICDTLQLQGMYTSNKIVDVFNASAHILQQPKVPLKKEDYAALGLQVLSLDDTPIPRWPENTDAGLLRIERGIDFLAEKYYPYNIAVVGHGYCVSQALSMAQPKGKHEGWSDYCGCVELRRTGQGKTSWQLAALNTKVQVQK